MTAKKLIKTLGLTDVFCISAGAMISSGIFILPGMAFAKIGPAVFLAYLLAGVCALVGTLATIELATAMPLAGGVYFYTGRSLGPLAGTISGLLNWSAIVLKSAFAIFGLSEVVHQFAGIDPVLCGVLMTLLFLAVNLVGTKEAAWAQIIMVGLLFAAMGMYIALGFPKLEMPRFSPLFHGGRGVTALFAEAAFVFVAFGGLLDVASVSEEVRNPKRNLPLGMIGATAAVTIVYVLTLIVTVGVSDASSLAKSFTPLADAAKLYYGTPGFVVITFGALMAFVTTANAGVMSAARFPYAMGRDQLIPPFFSRTCGKRAMPLPALLTTGIAMISVQFLPIEKLVTVASTVIMLSFILTNLSVIILRESAIQNYRPSFRVPFYPVVPIASMVMFALLILELGIGSVKMSLGIVAAGIILYFMFGRKVKLENAFSHLLGRLKNQKLKSHALESELREILRSRDNIVEDEFDRVVASSSAAIVRERISFEDLAKQICRKYTNDVPIDSDELAALLIERENNSGTVIYPSIAIPHIQTEIPDLFHLIIVKCTEGAIFPNEETPVRTAIFIFGSYGKRNLHLRALAAVAQVIQLPSFAERWNKAETPDQLKDLFLLAKRKRQEI